MVNNYYGKICEQLRTFIFPNLTNPEIYEILKAVFAQNFDKVLILNDAFKGFFNSAQVAPCFANLGTDYETVGVLTDFGFKGSEKPSFENTCFNDDFSYPYILRSALKEDEATYAVSGKNLLKGSDNHVTILSLFKLLVEFSNNGMVQGSFESSKEKVEQLSETIVQEKPSEEIKEIKEVVKVKENKWLILTGKDGMRTMFLKEDVVRVKDLNTPDPCNLRNDLKTKVILKNGNEFYGKESFEQICSSLS